MAHPDFALPEGETAEYLLAGLSHLIRLLGPKTFVAAPILLPEPAYFPDPVEERGRGAATLLRRLLAYAELEPNRVDVTLYDDGSQRDVRADDDHPSTAAWFVGVEENVYRFGIAERVLGDEEGLIGTLAHEVAHAYRNHHALAVRERDMEEKLTDLTTVYLGFGVFSLQNSFRFRTGHFSSKGERLLYEQSRGGYLRPGELAFLLAAQLVARDVDASEYARISRGLSPNQLAAVSEARKSLAAQRDWLVTQLRLPPRVDWPAPVSIESALAPLPPLKLTVRDDAAQRKAKELAERVAFRVVGTHATIGAVGGAGLGFLTGVILELQRGFWICTLGLGALGYVFGRRWHRTKCSSCDHLVPRRAEACSTCKAPLVGDIAMISDRLDAEERYRSIPGVRCPRCDARPRRGSLWQCSCGHRWNTFDTRGRCPACEKRWAETQCLSCGERPPHEDWYEVPSQRAEAE